MCNLDVIISVGYRVKSLRGILFRKWVSSILKQYLRKGYATDEKRLLAHDKSLTELSRKVLSLDARTQENEKRLPVMLINNHHRIKIALLEVTSISF